MSLKALFNRRVRGVRLLELWAFGFAVVLGLGVYLTKTGAGNEGAEIARLQRQITVEERRARLLRTEVAYLEQPERINRLSTRYLGLEPLRGERDIESDRLADAAAGRIKPEKGLPPEPAPAAVEETPAPAGLNIEVIDPEAPVAEAPVTVAAMAITAAPGEAR